MSLKCGSAACRRRMPAEFAAQYTVGQEGTVNRPAYWRDQGERPHDHPNRTGNPRRSWNPKRFSPIPRSIINVVGPRFVSVGGGVYSPQRLQWSQDLTLHTAIEDAGGLDDFGSAEGGPPDPGRQDYPNLRSVAFWRKIRLKIPSCCRAIRCTCANNNHPLLCVSFPSPLPPFLSLRRPSSAQNGFFGFGRSNATPAPAVPAAPERPSHSHWGCF